MVIRFGSKKPSKEDWRRYGCRYNFARRMAAANRFGRPFDLVKIVWDREGGYPEHAWGYIQWTVRPVWPGFGCDGTADAEHHARACQLLVRLGINADEVYSRAYADEGRNWLPSHSLQAVKPGEDYILPEGMPGMNEIRDMLYDLEQINNSSYLAGIVGELEKKGIEVPDYGEPSVRISGYPVPPSGEPLQVKTRMEEGCTVYCVSDGDSSMSLLREEALPMGPRVTWHKLYDWWKDGMLAAHMEGLRSVKARCRYLEGLIREGKAPAAVMECVARM